MNNYVIHFIFFLLFGTAVVAQSNVNIQKFEPGIVSTEFVEYSSSFSRDGQEVFFARSTGKWGKGKMKSVIYYSQYANGEWSSPKVVPFSGNYDDSGPHLSNDDKTLYFISKRPSEGIVISSDIWVVVRNDHGDWNTPQRLENPINSDKREYSPRTDNNGNLYFASDRDGGMGQGDLYLSQLHDGKYDEPVNMGIPLNSKEGEWNLEINDTGDVIIFEASGKEENVSPYGDLYISFKSDEMWSLPQNITELNTSGSDLYPQLMNDGTLYFTSSDSLKSTDTNIYYVDFQNLMTTYRGKAIYSK